MGTIFDICSFLWGIIRHRRGPNTNVIFALDRINCFDPDLTIMSSFQQIKTTAKRLDRCTKFPPLKPCIGGDRAAAFGPSRCSDPSRSYPPSGTGVRYGGMARSAMPGRAQFISWVGAGFCRRSVIGAGSHPRPSGGQASSARRSGMVGGSRARSQWRFRTFGSMENGWIAMRRRPSSRIKLRVLQYHSELGRAPGGSAARIPYA